ncbi:hypothetical protein NEA10_20700 (plasmid) [Phormidium yuhuli AB48]|uniref:Uncharacterized protein n=1 Tax=Phormidium yuhuli AB48 TaxID=2940671 RepID=A0ABY5AY71_9CYAN|nr:hypothetical protein [Phormidium yuhuli]USR93266.1 hypothetical protein NEA10_20700 [Phormidium yuhuli AB48]
MKFTNRHHFILPIFSTGTSEFWAVAPSDGHRRHAMKLAVEQSLFLIPSQDIEPYSCLDAKGIALLQTLGHDGNHNLRQTMEDSAFLSLVWFQAEYMGCGYFLATHDHKEVVCKFTDGLYTALEKEESIVGDNEYINRDELVPEINSEEFLATLKLIEPNPDKFWMYRLH